LLHHNSVFIGLSLSVNVTLDSFIDQLKMKVEQLQAETPYSRMS